MYNILLGLKIKQQQGLGLTTGPKLTMFWYVPGGAPSSGQGPTEPTDPTEHVVTSRVGCLAKT